MASMSALLVALGILVLALLTLMLWFVPHLLQQQSVRVAGETAQLREMLLDLLNEQESVAIRQTQLGTSLARLQSRLEVLAQPGQPLPSEEHIQQLEVRLTDIQTQLQRWVEFRQQQFDQRTVQDNESWGYLMSLLAAIQERLGTISHERERPLVTVQANALLEELEREMRNLRGISEDISTLQDRLRRSLSERESSLSTLRALSRRGDTAGESTRLTRMTG